MADERSVVLNALRRHGGKHLAASGALTGVIGRAQRLAASRLKTPEARALFSAWCVLCSTPCGVTAENTWLATRGEGRRWLCSTPCGVTAENTSGSAAIADADIVLLAGHAARVLNALRRHGGKHALVEVFVLALLPLAVLNALRRHGGKHSEFQQLELAALVCSTPCGVTAENTCAPQP